MISRSQLTNQCTSPSRWSTPYTTFLGPLKAFSYRRPGCFQERRAAFTLIELLVVISIMSLLISILLPALSRARENARRTVCGTNLREVGRAFWAYAEQNDGWFPVKGRPPTGRPDPDNPEPPAPIDELATIQHLGTRAPTGPDGWGLQFAGMLRDIVERELTHNGGETRYLYEPKILVCPSDTKGNKYATTRDPNENVALMDVRPAENIIDIKATNQATEKNYSYMYVALWRNDDRAEFFMMGDESDKADNTTQSLTGLTRDDNHGLTGLNALYCDLRVEWAGARGGDFNSLQELALKLWGPAVVAPNRYPGTQGNRSSEVQTID